MRKRKVDMIKKSKKIVKVIKNTLEKLSKYNKKIIITNETIDNKFIIKLGFINEEPIYELAIDRLNEDIYDYILISIYNFLREEETSNSYISNNYFIVNVDNDRIKATAKFKSAALFIFESLYDKKEQYIKILENDMISKNFEDNYDINRQLRINAKRLTKIQNSKIN